MKKVLIGISLLLNFNSFAQREDPNEIKVSGYEEVSSPKADIIAKYNAIELAEEKCGFRATRVSDWSVKEITRTIGMGCYGCQGSEISVQYIKATALFKCN